MTFRHHAACLSYETTSSGSPTRHNNRPPLVASGAAPRLLSPEGDVLSPGNQGGVHALGPRACGAEPSLGLPRAQPCAPATPRLDSCPRLPLSNPARRSNCTSKTFRETGNRWGELQTALSEKQMREKRIENARMYQAW